MSDTGCTICAGEDLEAIGEWCRVCGRNKPPPSAPEPRRSELQEAIRKARGTEPTGEEVENSIRFLNEVIARKKRPPTPREER